MCPTETLSISIDSSHSMIAAREINSGLLDIAVGYQYRFTKGVVFKTLLNKRLVLVTSWPRQPTGALLYSDWLGRRVRG